MDGSQIPPQGQRLKEAGRALIRQAAVIDGQLVDDGAPISVDDPSDGSEIGHVPSLSPERVDAAIEGTAKAFDDWSRRPEAERAKVLRAWAAKIDEKRDALGALLSLENGKAYAEGAGEIDYANGFVKWYAAEAETLQGDVIASPTGDRIITFKEPVGPVAAVTPWNFPAAMITRKVAPALAAGCTVVLKPASATPFTAVALAELALEAGVPAGVFNVVHGPGGKVGTQLAESGHLRKLSFTGSTEVGRDLAARCAPTLKRLSLELGGSAPLIVFDDADLDNAVDGTVRGKFRGSGQTCVCPNRIYVQRGIYKAFVEKLAAKVAALKVGAAFEPDVQIGPLIDDKAVLKVEDHIARSKAAGARVVVGGARHERGGRFFQPTVVADWDGDELFRREETFGPLVPVFAFDTEEEVLQRANDSEFGLASYLFTENLKRAIRVARKIEAGMVGLNTGLMSNAANPFGGIKQSGYGREGSKYGLEEYLQVKSVTLAGTGL